MNAYYLQWDDLEESNIRDELEISDEDYDLELEQENDDEDNYCPKCKGFGCKYCEIC